jgi:hypothetical protein
MKRSARIATILMALAFFAGAATGQTCLPVITPPMIDGIVATDPFHLHGGVPNADIGWATAPYMPFFFMAPPPGTTPSTQHAFFIGTKLAGANPDHLYVGVHVEGADQFSNGDKVVLYFDTNQDNTFDFALSYEIGPLATVSTNANSNQTPNSMTFYTFANNTFSDQTLALNAGTINSHTAYNFMVAANGIWELEIDINLTALKNQFGTIQVANKIGFGARLYVKPAGTSAVALDFPAKLSTDQNANDVFPGSGGVVAAALEQRAVSATCAGDVQIHSLKSRARNGDDLFYLPKDADFAMDGSLPLQFQTQLTGEAIYVNTGDVGNTSTTGGINNGNIHFHLLPWGMGPVEDVDLGPVPIPADKFDHFGTAASASINWPTKKSDWDPVKGPFLNHNVNAGGSDHVCLRIKLEGFVQDSDLTNNEQQINLQYTTMSTHTDRIVIHAPGTATPGAPKEDYAMRVRWDNVPKNQVRDPGHDKECWLRRLCDRLHHRNYWQAQFVNSDKLGIKPLKTRGYYGLQLAPGEEVVAEVQLSGAVMPVPSQEIHVSPRAGGQVLSPASGDPAVVVTVPDGGMVTVVARGQISILGEQNATGVVVGQLHNANGFPDRGLSGQQLLLSNKVTVPWKVAGALIGAFKPDFSDSFFIGTEGTFYVTPGATKLYLAVNDVAGQYGNNGGPGFDLNVVATPPTTLPTKLSWPANATLGLPGIPQPAANLPMLVIDLYRIDGKQKAAVPVGYVAYGVYQAHNDKQGGGVGNVVNRKK